MTECLHNPEIWTKYNSCISALFITFLQNTKPYNRYILHKINTRTRFHQWPYASREMYILSLVWSLLNSVCIWRTVGWVLESSWNVMAHGDAWEGKWRGNWRMQWVASTLHTTSEHGVSSITTADVHTSAASSWLNWRPLADLNGLVRFAERQNLVSTRVLSHFKHTLLLLLYLLCMWVICCFILFKGFSVRFNKVTERNCHNVYRIVNHWTDPQTSRSVSQVSNTSYMCLLC